MEPVGNAALPSLFGAFSAWDVLDGVVLDRAFEDRELEDTRAHAEDVHDRPIGVTWRSVGFLLTLELADHEQKIARFDVADPPTSDQWVHVVLEAPKVPFDITHAIGLLRFEPSLGHGSKCHTRAGNRTDGVSCILQAPRLMELAKRSGFVGSESNEATIRRLHPVREAVRIEAGRPTLLAPAAHDPRSSSHCNTSGSRKRSLRPARTCGQP